MQDLEEKESIPESIHFWGTYCKTNKITFHLGKNQHDQQTADSTFQVKKIDQ